LGGPTGVARTCHGPRGVQREELDRLRLELQRLTAKTWRAPRPPPARRTTGSTGAGVADVVRSQEEHTRGPHLDKSLPRREHSHSRPRHLRDGPHATRSVEEALSFLMTPRRYGVRSFCWPRATSTNIESVLDFDVTNPLARLMTSRAVRDLDVMRSPR